MDRDVPFFALITLRLTGERGQEHLAPRAPYESGLSHGKTCLPHRGATASTLRTPGSAPRLCPPGGGVTDTIPRNLWLPIVLAIKDRRARGLCFREDEVPILSKDHKC